MYSTKITVATGVLLLFITATVYIAFSKSESAQEIRYGISQSIDEDFKIKESLGQVFFVKSEENVQQVSSNVSIQGKILPVEGEISYKLENGEKIALFNCEKYSDVFAVESGTLEKWEKGRITLRHSNGSKSVYTGVHSIKKTGEKVYGGEKIGYAIKQVGFKAYGRCCTVIDTEEYFS